MPRFALKVEYHGAPFAGWQRQADQPSVQGAIEAALARLEPGPHTIAAAGRTDAGVHGLAQVAQCDLAKPWDPEELRAVVRTTLTDVVEELDLDPLPHLAALDPVRAMELVRRRTP